MRYINNKTNRYRPVSVSDSYLITSYCNLSDNNIVLLESSTPPPAQSPQSPQSPQSIAKYEKNIVEILIKLLLHITLISIFETLFYFLYVSSLEDSGINTTVNTFINDAASECSNISQTEITIINDIVEYYVNISNVIMSGNREEQIRYHYNQNILVQSWVYVIVLVTSFIMVMTYAKYRKLSVNWGGIVLENTGMVLLLALYELMFFNTIIYPYQSISTNEIARNAIYTFQSQCKLFNDTSSTTVPDIHLYGPLPSTTTEDL